MVENIAYSIFFTIPRRCTPVCRNRCDAGGASRGPCARRSDRRLGTAPLRVALCVQANRNDTLTGRLAPAAESTVSGMGCPRRWRPEAREGRGSVELVEIFQMRIVACRFTPVCRNRCGAGGAGRGPGAGWSDRRLGTAPLRAALCVQANRNDTLAGRLGTAAESTVSGTGCPRRWTPEPGRAGDR